MGWYQSWVVPRLVALSMDNPRLLPYRRRVLAEAQGRVLEIGIGAGANLSLYGAAVERIYGVDPSPALLARAEARRAGARAPVVLMAAPAERLPLAAAAVDTVVMTWTLCSVADPMAALEELRRVLRPGGRLLFVEHGRAPEPSVERWQRRLTPLWRRLAGGCHLDRRTDALLSAAGFAIGRLDTGYMEGPKPLTFMYEGKATRPA